MSFEMLNNLALDGRYRTWFGQRHQFCKNRIISTQLLCATIKLFADFMPCSLRLFTTVLLWPLKGVEGGSARKSASCLQHRQKVLTLCNKEWWIKNGRNSFGNSTILSGVISRSSAYYANLICVSLFLNDWSSRKACYSFYGANIMRPGTIHYEN